MPKTSEAQLRAVRKHDAEKRTKKPIGCRLEPEVLARVDKKLKGGSRSALVERLIMDWLG